MLGGARCVPGLGVPPLAEAPPPASHRAALSLQRGLLIAMLPLHLVMGLSQASTFAWTAYATAVAVRAHQPLPFHSGYVVGETIVTVCLLVWSIGGGVWAVKLLRALDRLDPRLERSMKRYWLFSALSCLCFPIGIIGFANATRRDVGEALSGIRAR